MLAKKKKTWPIGGTITDVNVFLPRFSDIGPAHFFCIFPLLSHHTLININAFFLVTLIFCCNNRNVIKQYRCGVTPEDSHIVK